MYDLYTFASWLVTPDGGPPPFVIPAAIYACLNIRRFLSTVES